MNKNSNKTIRFLGFNIGIGRLYDSYKLINDNTDTFISVILFSHVTPYTFSGSCLIIYLLLSIFNLIYNSFVYGPARAYMKTLKLFKMAYFVFVLFNTLYFSPPLVYDLIILLIRENNSKTNKIKCLIAFEYTHVFFVQILSLIGILVLFFEIIIYNERVKKNCSYYIVSPIFFLCYITFFYLKVTCISFFDLFTALIIIITFLTGILPYSFFKKHLNQEELAKFVISLIYKFINLIILLNLRTIKFYLSQANLPEEVAKSLKIIY